MAESLDAGRDAYRRRSWGAAFTQLTSADRESPLHPDDLDRLVAAAYLIGHDDVATELSARAYRERLVLRDTAHAARIAFWLGFHLLLRGELARGGGWLARAQAVVDEMPDPGVVAGFLLVPTGLMAIEGGEVQRACDDFGRAADIGRRFADTDLIVLAQLGRGQAMIRLGETGPGLAMLDEVMIAVTAGEVAPLVVGIAYCAVIEACREVFDLRRSREWTAALTRWCEAQPELVPFRGQCLVHRAEIMQSRGEWADAMDEAQRACVLLTDPPGQPAAGLAFYQLGELYRLRGDDARADQAYRQASRWIADPQPGLALLLLARGDVHSAAATIRRVLDRAEGPGPRARLLGASVDIMLAAGDNVEARAAAEELRSIADGMGTPWLRALGLDALAAVSRADSEEPAAALDHAREAWTLWREVGAPYEAARSRVAVGLALRRMGDEVSAQMEFDAAGWVFQQLGAGPDAIRTQALAGRGDGPARGPLTHREADVLRLVATGRTNRAIAAELFLSEKTVARHMSNIFGKLGLKTRAAATAYAYEQGLVHPAGPPPA